MWVHSIRVVDGDDIEWEGTRYRLDRYDTPEIMHLRSQIDRELEKRRGLAAKWAFINILREARTVHVIDHGRVPVFPGTRFKATLLVNGHDIANIAVQQGWGVPYAVRRQTDWGDPQRPFPNLPIPDEALLKARA